MMSTLGRRVLARSGALLVAGAVMLSAWFAARAVTHVAEAAAFADRRRPAGGPAAPPLAPPPPAPAAELGPAPQALVTRNMFCSTCAPATEAGPRPPAGAAAHQLPRLIATHVGRPGWVTVDDPATGVAGAFALGATLPGGGVIDAIEPGAMFVRFPDSEAVRVPLASDGGPGAGPPAPAGARAPAAADAWADRVRAVGDHRWEVDRRMIRELVQAGAGGASPVKGVRLTPVNQGGKLAGVRVTAGRGSLAQALGLQTGDVIERIDGRAIDSPAVLMEVYGQLEQLRRVDLGVRRKGTAETLIYDLP